MAMQVFPEHRGLQGPDGQARGSSAAGWQPGPAQPDFCITGHLLVVPGERLGGRDPGICPGVGLTELLMEDLVALQAGLMWSMGLAGGTGSR